MRSTRSQISGPAKSKWGAAALAALLAAALAGAIYVRRAASGGPEQPFYEAGIAAVQAGKLQDAIADFQASVEANPGFARGYELLADSYLAVGRVTPALDALDRVRLTWPDRPHVYTRIAECHASLDNLDLTRWSLAAVIAEPRSPRAHLLLCLARARAGDRVKALEELQTAGTLGGAQCQAAAASIRAGDPAVLELSKRLKAQMELFPY